MNDQLPLDYPAAHSMDTTWFAVDADGHVAAFDSGEPGAVPLAAHSDQEENVVGKLAGLRPVCNTVHDLRGRIPPPNEAPPHAHPFTWYTDETVRELWDRYQALVQAAGEPKPESPPTYPYPVLMFVESLDAVREEIERGLAQTQLSAGPPAVIFSTLPAYIADRLHDAGQCLGCFELWRLDNPFLTEPTRVGLYAYDHCDVLYEAAPYGRTALPQRPVRLDELPPDLQARIGRVRFDKIRFAETPFIQPAEHVPCASWGAAYLSEDWRTLHPLPDREDEYRDNYEEAQQHPQEWEGYEWTPP